MAPASSNAARDVKRAEASVKRILQQLSINSDKASGRCRFDRRNFRCDETFEFNEGELLKFSEYRALPAVRCAARRLFRKIDRPP